MAVSEDGVLGHVGFTRGYLDSLDRLRHVLVLSPLGVRPDGQDHGLEIATQLIRAKLEASRATLQGLWQSPTRHSGLAGLDKAIADIKAPPTSYDEIRLIEARGAAVYFAGWQDQPIKWKGLSRQPIPPDWHRCGLRSGALVSGNRHATHPINAMLNYGYAVLESEVRIAVIRAGLDPEIGYLHSNRRGRLSLVYDLTEPMRPVVDRAILSCVNDQTFAPKDFTLSERGVCRLHPQLARRFVEILPKSDVLTATVHDLLGSLERLVAAETIV